MDYGKNSDKLFWALHELSSKRSRMSIPYEIFTKIYGPRLINTIKPINALHTYNKAHSVLLIRTDRRTQAMTIPLGHGQARFGLILMVFSPNDLEGQGQMSSYAIPSENYPWYTCKPNLVILAAFFQKLSRGQASSYRRTDGRTDTNIVLKWLPQNFP